MFSMPNKKTVMFSFDNRDYVLTPGFALVREIEEELGGISLLRGRFLQNRWEVSELVTLMQMMLQAAGETVDYDVLGGRMLEEGMGRYLVAVLSLFELVLAE